MIFETLEQIRCMLHLKAITDLRA